MHAPTCMLRNTGVLKAAGSLGYKGSPLLTPPVPKLVSVTHIRARRAPSFQRRCECVPPLCGLGFGRRRPQGGSGRRGRRPRRERPQKGRTRSRGRNRVWHLPAGVISQAAGRGALSKSRPSSPTYGAEAEVLSVLFRFSVVLFKFSIAFSGFLLLFRVSFAC